MSRRISLGLIVCLLFSGGRAFALSSETKSMVRAGGWGLLGGTALGLAALPATKSARGVFIGSSIGLYLGLVAGAFLLASPDDAARLRAAAAPDESVPERDTRPSVAFSYPVLRW